MLLVLGPVSSESARAWLGFARTVVRRLENAEGPALSADVVAIFSTYLDSWEKAARAKVFRWEREIPAEEAEYHVHAFFQVANALHEESQALGRRLSPDEAEEFYVALVESILTALKEDSESSAEFASHLAAFWPGRATFG